MTNVDNPICLVHNSGEGVVSKAGEDQEMEMQS